MSAIVDQLVEGFVQLTGAIDARFANFDPTGGDAATVSGKTLSEIETEYGLAITLAVGAVADALDAFMLRTDNPHQVDAVQVGLGDVANHPVADNVVELAATSDAHYSTAKGIADQWAQWWAAKIGDAPAELDTIEELALALQNNPEIITDILSMVGGKLGVNATAADTELFDGATLVDFATTVLSETFANALLLDGRSIADLTASEADVLTATRTDVWVPPAHLDAGISTTPVQNTTNASDLDQSLNALLGAVNNARLTVVGQLIDFGFTAINTEYDALGATPQSNMNINKIAMGEGWFVTFGGVGTAASCLYCNISTEFQTMLSISNLTISASITGGEYVGDLTAGGSAAATRFVAYNTTGVYRIDLLGAGGTPRQSSSSPITLPAGINTVNILDVRRRPQGLLVVNRWDSAVVLINGQTLTGTLRTLDGTGVSLRGCAVDGNTLYVHGDAIAPATSRIFRSTNNGTTWSSLPGPDGVTLSGILASRCDAGGGRLVCAVNNTLHIFEDGQWRQLIAPGSVSRLNYVAGIWYVFIAAGIYASVDLTSLTPQTRTPNDARVTRVMYAVNPGPSGAVYACGAYGGIAKATPPAV